MKQSIYTLIAILFCIQLLTANEIIPIWNNSAKANIQDMEIMPGGDEFILTTHDATIEIRSTEDGSLIREYVDTSNLFVAGDIEFTPDSTRIILGVSGLLQILDLETFERQEYFAFGPDTIARGFSNLVVDPIRPFVYATINGFEKTSGNNNPVGKIQAYNYETMEPVRNLTEYGNNRYEVLAISSDGHYLATINGGIKAYLKIWDLNTNELIVNKPLFDNYSERKCEPYDIVFSNINKNIVYISGSFTEKVHSNDIGSGLFSYNFNKDIRKLIIPNEIYGSEDILFFDNEVRCISTTVGHIGIINLFNENLEYYDSSPQGIYSTLVRYNKYNDSFLSSNFTNKTSCSKYDRETSIELTEKTNSFTISPNPAGSYIEINDIISTTDAVYTINSMTGEELMKFNPNEINNINIDMLSSGTYFITKKIGNKTETQKFIKR